MLLKASEINFTSTDKDDSLFGEAVISPKPFKMNAEEDEASGAGVATSDVANDQQNLSF